MTTQDNQDAERAAFEAAYQSEFPVSVSLSMEKFERDECGDYKENCVYTAHRLWQSARRASTPAEAGAGLPDLPAQHDELRARWECEDCGGRGHDGEAHWQGHFQPPEPFPCATCGGNGSVRVDAYTADQVPQAQRDAVEADRQQQMARIQHLTHERDIARSDSRTWHRLVMSLGAVFGFDTAGSATEVADAACAVRANFAADRAALSRQSATTCAGCEGKPSGSNNPCAVCGKTESATTVGVEPVFQVMEGEFGEYWSDVDKATFDAANNEGIETRTVYLAAPAHTAAPIADTKEKS